MSQTKVDLFQGLTDPLSVINGTDRSVIIQFDNKRVRVSNLTEFIMSNTPSRYSRHFFLPIVATSPSEWNPDVPIYYSLMLMGDKSRFGTDAVMAIAGYSDLLFKAVPEQAILPLDGGELFPDLVVTKASDSEKFFVGVSSTVLTFSTLDCVPSERARLHTMPVDAPVIEDYDASVLTSPIITLPKQNLKFNYPFDLQLRKRLLTVLSLMGINDRKKRIKCTKSTVCVNMDLYYVTYSLSAIVDDGGVKRYLLNVTNTCHPALNLFWLHAVADNLLYFHNQLHKYDR